MDNNYPINSKEYWDTRFSSNDWNNRNGEGQSTFFMQLLISNLPYEIFVEIFNNCKTILDFGSSLGQGCYELSKSFHNTKITGLDLSDEAIRISKELYPQFNFTSSPLQETDRYDCLITSNTLEHLSDWEDYLYLFTLISQKYIMILVPFKTGIFDEHFVEFSENSFPEKINGFDKVFNKVIQCNEPKYWTDEQYLVIYKKN